MYADSNSKWQVNGVNQSHSNLLNVSLGEPIMKIVLSSNTKISEEGLIEFVEFVEFLLCFLQE